MAYLLKHAEKPGRIAEREWAVGQAIKFTPFTSCIAVVARVAGRDKVIGIHLSMRDASDQLIAPSDINQVINLLHEWRYDAQSLHIIGYTSLWSATDKVNEAYRTLKRVWEKVPQENVFGDGTLAVSIKNGRMTFTYTYSNKDCGVHTFYFPEQQEVPAAAPGLGPLDAPIDVPLSYPHARARSTRARARSI